MGGRLVKRLCVLVLAGAAVLAACSDDDDTAGTTTAPPTSNTAVASTLPTTTLPTTEAVTTSTPTTSSTVAPTAPPTTESIEALKAQIAADYVASDARLTELVAQPSLDNLRRRVARVAAPGEYFELLVGRVKELIRLGDKVVPGDPPIHGMTVESVRLIGQPPYQRAVLTVCEVDNSRQVTPAENSPIGSDVFSTNDVVRAVRSRQPVRQTEYGWLPYRVVVNVDGRWEGVTECPAD
jgi:hypothetical protein